MLNRRIFIKEVLGALAGFGSVAAPLFKQDVFSAPSDSCIDPTDFDQGRFHLRKTAMGYIAPSNLAVFAGAPLIITRSLQPGRLALFSEGAWADLVEKVRLYQAPNSSEVRSAMLRLIIAPAAEINLRDHYLELPESLLAHTGLENTDLVLAFDGKNGYLQAA